MNYYVLALGIATVIFAAYQYYRGKQILQTGEVVEAKVIKVKNKTNKGRPYCYPKLLIDQYGVEETFYCYSARTSGRDKYYEGQILQVRRYNKLFGGIDYFYGAEMKLNYITAVLAGVVLIIASFVV